VSSKTFWLPYPCPAAARADPPNRDRDPTLLTGRGIACAVLAAALSAGGWVLSLPELYAAGTGVAAVALLALAWVWVPRRRPRLTVGAHPNPATARTTVNVTASIAGRSLRPVLLTGSISDGRSIRLWARPGLKGFQHGTFAVPVPTRGVLRVGPFTMESSDPLGLARRTVGRGSGVLINVRPAVSAAEPVMPGAARSETRHEAQLVSAKAVAAAGTELAGVRPYVAGDELRLVHWTASAKGRGMLVRTFDPDESAVPVVLLDDRAEVHSDESFELALECAASIVSSQRRSAIDPSHGTGLMLWSEIVAGNQILRRYGDAALDSLVTLQPAKGLPTRADHTPPADLVITGPYLSHARRIDVGSAVPVLMIDPRGRAEDRSVGSVADFRRWHGALL
jgi:hypothetical protein